MDVAHVFTHLYQITEFNGIERKMQWTNELLMSFVKFILMDLGPETRAPASSLWRDTLFGRMRESNSTDTGRSRSELSGVKPKCVG